MVAAVGRGRILIWEGASLWLMEALPSSENAPNTTDFHSHHAVQVTLSLGGSFVLRTRDFAASSDVAAAPDVSHIFEALGHVALLFIEPESRPGRAITKTMFEKSPLAKVASERVADLVVELKRNWAHSEERANDAVLIGLGRALVSRLAGGSEAELPDPRVQKMVAYANSRLGDAVTLAEAAGSACLSPSRARHLFVEQTGLPFRTYLLWMRLSEAVGIFAAGGSLTEAAHKAGFSDSAHFSRTFRRMFGLPAAALRID